MFHVPSYLLPKQINCFGQNDFKMCFSLTYIRMYVYTYIHTYVHTYIRTYVRTYVCTYIHTYVRTYICMYLHTYAHIKVCPYVKCSPVYSKHQGLSQGGLCTEVPPHSRASDSQSPIGYSTVHLSSTKDVTTVLNVSHLYGSYTFAQASRRGQSLYKGRNA